MRSEVLSGWKDIANYLGKGVRTVQRYERELGLPVRRPSGKTKGSVMATQPELNAWVASCALSDRSRRSSTVLDLSAYTSLKHRIAEMDKLSERMRKLRLEIRACRETLSATIQRIHEGANHDPTGFKKISVQRLSGKRIG